MNIYFADPSQNSPRKHSHVSDPELAEEIILPRPFIGLIKPEVTSLSVSSKTQGAPSINVLNNQNHGKIEYAVEGNENKEKLSEWSAPENISDTAMRLQAEVIYTAAPEKSQLVRQSSSIMTRKVVHPRRRTSIYKKHHNIG